MDDPTFAAEIATLLRETRGVEFKRSLNLGDKASVALVARAVMAMSNRANGGMVVIGVSEDASGLHFDGLDAADFATWKADDLSDKLFPFTDPPVQFELTTVMFDGRRFHVIDVQEFDEVPTVTKRSYPGTLVEGAIYVRPRRKPESVAIPTAADMRDLLDLATEKRARRLLAQVERLGVAGQPQQPDDTDLYKAEAADLLG